MHGAEVVPSSEQRAAAASQASMNAANTQTQKEMLSFYKAQQAKIDPYATNLLNKGLDFYPALTDYNRGSLAQSYLPAYASLNRRLSSQGAFPSGYRDTALSALDAQRARDFDSMQVQNMFANQQARSQGADLLTNQQTSSNPLGWAGAVTQGNTAVMNAPLASPGLAGALGGAMGMVGQLGQGKGFAGLF